MAAQPIADTVKTGVADAVKTVATAVGSAEEERASAKWIATIIAVVCIALTVILGLCALFNLTGEGTVIKVCVQAGLAFLCLDLFFLFMKAGAIAEGSSFGPPPSWPQLICKASDQTFLLRYILPPLLKNC